MPMIPSNGDWRVSPCLYWCTVGLAAALPTLIGCGVFDGWKLAALCALNAALVVLVGGGSPPRQNIRN